MLNKFQLLTINRKISSAKRILIVSHSNPDGDAVGASLALYHFFKEQQYIVHIILPNDFPSFYTWMPGSEKIIIYENNKLGAEEIVNSANVIFCLDFNALSRIGKLGSIIKTSSAFRIMIDHHPYPEDEFDIIFSQINTSSTSELVYDFIFQLEKDELINKEIAECIYTGIMTDTGSFSYSCNYEKTYRLIAQLFRLGINGEKIHQLVYDTYSEDRMRLLGFCLKERLVVNKELGTAYIYLSKDDLAKYDYQVGDTEGVVNYALAIAVLILQCYSLKKKI
jgi:phosphoesterase RecJ-like protein